ncbi:MAG: diacylglycerol kinase family protein, partial [Methyloligellaceae bacterium]
MRKRFFLIHNLSAGIKRRRLLRVVLAKLAEAGATVTICSPKTQEADKALAKEAAGSGQYDAVVTAGGDST